MREDEVMESDKKRGSGWRALGTAIGGFMMIPLTLYVAAYYWTVFPCPNVHVARPLSDEDLETILSGWAVPRYDLPYTWERYVDCRWAFTPIHLIDRQIRRK